MRSVLLALLFCTVACDSDDPTFMLVCEDAQGFHYPKDNEVASKACADPKPITWPGLPVRVSLASLDSDYHASLTQAIDLWNSELDMTVFVVDEVDPQVDVSIGIATDPNIFGATSHTRDVNGDLFAYVELRQPGSVESAYYVFLHELGHVVGLAHDACCRSSVMYPDGFDADGEDFPVVFITGNDQDALHAAYP